MPKAKQKIFLVISVVIGLALVIQIVHAELYSSTYLPIVMGGYVAPTVEPTAEPTTPAPTDPIPVGETIHFKGWEHSTPLSGTVVASEFKTSLQPNYGNPVVPAGVFVVVTMDVTNTGLESDAVGIYSAFRVQDDAGRKFDMAGMSAQTAAQNQYKLPGAYGTLQPGFTLRMVFVFDVLPASAGMHLLSGSPW